VSIESPLAGWQARDVRCPLLFLAILGFCFGACGRAAEQPAPPPPPSASSSDSSPEPAPTPSPASPPAPPSSEPNVPPASTLPGEPLATPSIERLPDPASVPELPTGLRNGDWAPELALTDLRTKKPWKLSDHVGPQARSKAKVVLVEFSASWCGPCKASYPSLRDLEAEHGGDLEVVVVSSDVTIDAQQEEVDIVRAAGLDAPVLAGDETTLRAWLGGKRNVPHIYVLNKAGEVLVQDRGFGEKVKKVLPGQIRYALSHPDYVARP
jgi:thiol-disulfide isomerase/thioredoxin